MSDCRRDLDGLRALIQSCAGFNSEQTMEFYNNQAETYHQMFERGFRNFVGVDCSKEMLEQAAATGLYQKLHQALLGTEPLPAQPGVFDLVVLVGGLGVGFAPVCVVRELCEAAKPGGLICVARGNHTTPEEREFGVHLNREVQLMEEEGLWSRVAVRQVDRYMLDPQLKTKVQGDMVYIPGSLYLYRKSVS
ncbi:methyltransferase-like protein 27 isoform X2 [Fundulus heteroclitus]|uniref:methyltransferase-like protein 27 isoform X2 n=1 Tax=Fundulus heteroclitus TaxID=8078 RepID=UPI00165A4870|nr:methyltransferase-like protein 27 isoform X2 [Fundulus heteroclitus]